MNVFLRGNYENEFSKLMISTCSRKTKKVVFIVHGLYGETGDSGSKSELLSKDIIKNQLAHTVCYSSSRNWSLYHNLKPEKQDKAFLGKSFKQELQDLIEAILLIKAQSEFLFNISSCNLEFSCIGNSFGGTALVTVVSQFPYIKELCLCGSGTGKRSLNKPILESFPNSNKIVIDSAINFKGRLLFLQGELDDVVPIKIQNEFFESFQNVEYKNKIVIKGSNHNFNKKNGILDDSVKNEYVSNIIKFLIN
jgi:alpha/beta superfamily hydrolase